MFGCAARLSSACELGAGVGESFSNPGSRSVGAAEISAVRLRDSRVAVTVLKGNQVNDLLKPGTGRLGRTGRRDLDHQFLDDPGPEVAPR